MRNILSIYKQSLTMEAEDSIYEDKNFIFDKSQLNRLNSGDTKKIFEHYQAGHKFFFPHKELNTPQKEFICQMFKCLDYKTGEQEGSHNLLIESPTGSGKTLSLLTTALAWAQERFRKSKSEQRTKVIYCSRTHSQLVQIEKQLSQTCYRPQMLIFAAKSRLCINKKIIDQSQKQSDNKLTNQWWDQKCAKALQKNTKYSELKRKRQEKDKNNLNKKQEFKTKIQQKKKKHQNISQKQQTKLEQPVEKQPISKTQSINSKAMCPHFKKDIKVYEKFHKKLAKTVLTLDIVKQKALENTNQNGQPETVCPFYYSKKLKYKGKLYLMPYDYMLTQSIVDFSSGLLKNSIVIFDEGHNVQKTACQGYSVKYQQKLINQQIDLLLGKQKKADNLDIKEQQQQRQQDIKNMEQDNEKKRSQPCESNKSQDRHWNSNNNNNPDLPQIQQNKGTPSEQFIKKALKKMRKSFNKYFEKQITSFQLPSKYNNETNLVRLSHMRQVKKIKQSIQNILFSSNQEQKDYQNQGGLETYLVKIEQNLMSIIQQRRSNKKSYFNAQSIRRFILCCYQVIFKNQYHGKYFLNLKQKKVWQFNQYLPTKYQGSFQLTCLSMQFAFKKLRSMNPKSIIITSGTLKPFHYFTNQAKQKNIKFTTKFTKHVIKNSQMHKHIRIRAIGVDTNNQDLKIAIKFYEEIDNLKKAWNVVLELIKHINHGVLIMVSSYFCLNKLEAYYNEQSTESKNLRQRILQFKKVYFENKLTFKKTIEEYKQNSIKGNGALLVCVARGKLSEGIDYKNQLCRGVIFLGVPLINFSKPREIYKKQFVRQNVISPQESNDYSEIQAARAINQGLGRVLRHKDDYGVMILVDSRYSQKDKQCLKVRENLSQWIKPTYVDTFKQLTEHLDAFKK